MIFLPNNLLVSCEYAVNKLCITVFVKISQYAYELYVFLISTYYDQSLKNIDH